MRLRLAFATCSFFAAAGAVSAQTINPALDHFNCYFVANEPPEAHAALLLDQFDISNAPSTTVQPGRFETIRTLTPFQFCNPTAKIHNDVTTGIVNRDAHLLMYHTNPQPATHRLVAIQNQFTPVTAAAPTFLTTGAATILAVPSSKQVVSSTAPPQLPSTQSIESELDHFKCYQVLTGASVNASVALTDQFRAEQATVLTPVLFCNPVLKVTFTVTSTNPLGVLPANTPTPPVNLPDLASAPTVTPVNRPDKHLTCYAIRTQPFPGINVFYDNQFVPPGAVSTLRLLQSQMLCVPTQKLSWSVIVP